jgi:hypothetical protein
VKYEKSGYVSSRLDLALAPTNFKMPPGVITGGKAIPIEDRRRSPMRLPHGRINGKWVAASKPQALGMDANVGSRLNMYFAGMTALIGQFESISML